MSCLEQVRPHHSLADALSEIPHQGTESRRDLSGTMEHGRTARLFRCHVRAYDQASSESRNFDSVWSPQKLLITNRPSCSA